MLAYYMPSLPFCPSPFQIQFWQQGYREDTLREWDVSPEDALASRVGVTFKATVEDLLPFTTMEVTIAIMNNYYVSQPSDVFRFVTQAGCEFTFIMHYRQKHTCTYTHACAGFCLESIHVPHCFTLWDRHSSRSGFLAWYSFDWLKLIGWLTAQNLCANGVCLAQQECCFTVLFTNVWYWMCHHPFPLELTVY